MPLRAWRERAVVPPQVFQAGPGTMVNVGVEVGEKMLGVIQSAQSVYRPFAGHIWAPERHQKRLVLINI